MGLHNLPEIVSKLISAGLSDATPVALIRQGTRADQSELIGCLSNIVELVQETKFAPPAIAVIGNIVNFREQVDNS
jgi:uroporphyrin-III C-methyltransferase